MPSEVDDDDLIDIRGLRLETMFGNEKDFDYEPEDDISLELTPVRGFNNFFNSCAPYGKKCGLNSHGLVKKCCAGYCIPHPYLGRVCSPLRKCRINGYRCRHRRQCCDAEATCQKMKKFALKRCRTKCVAEKGRCKMSDHCCKGECNRISKFRRGTCESECVNIGEKCGEHDKCCTGRCFRKFPLGSKQCRLCIPSGHICHSGDSCCSGECNRKILLKYCH